MDIKLIMTLSLIYIGLLFVYFNLFIFLLEEKKKKKIFKEYPKVSIIVPAYNEEKNIEKAIKSLLELDYPKDRLEIIVVDDGSKDKTYEIAKKFESDIVKVYKKENGGKASALNYGIKKATGELIVTLDADSVVPKDALKKMLEYFDEEDVMIVVPSIQVENTDGWVAKVQIIEYAYNNVLRKIFDKLNSIYVAPGPFSVFRRELFDKIGYFDEKNLTEDMEIAMRTQAYGYKIRHCPDVVVRTKVPTDLKSLIRQRLRWYLGFVENFSVYKDKIGNKILVDLIFGSAILFVITPIISLSIFLYDFFKPIYDNILYYYYIDFNIIPLIKYSIYNFSKFFDELYFQYLAGGLFLLFFSVVLTGIFIYFLKKYWEIDKSNSRSEKVISFIFYSWLYLLLYATFWIVVFYYKIFGKELRWGGIVWRNSLINKWK